MSNQQLDKLFTPFTRFENENIEGIGLGLALSKVLVELNSGEISVESEPGKGTEFVVTFPAREVLGEPALVELPEEVAARATGASVLVVDDDADTVRVMSRSLSNAGFKVLEAYTVNEAVGLLRFEKIDFVLSDCSMPGGGAKALMQVVRSLEHPPIVALVSGQSAELSSELKGIAQYFSKPAEIGEIIGWINSYSAETGPEVGLPEEHREIGNL